MFTCNEHGDDVVVQFSRRYGPGGCPVCELAKTIQRLEDELEYEEDLEVGIP